MSLMRSVTKTARSYPHSRAWTMTDFPLIVSPFCPHFVPENAGPRHSLDVPSLCLDEG